MVWGKYPGLILNCGIHLGPVDFPQSHPGPVLCPNLAGWFAFLGRWNPRTRSEGRTSVTSWKSHTLKKKYGCHHVLPISHRYLYCSPNRMSHIKAVLLDHIAALVWKSNGVGTSFPWLRVGKLATKARSTAEAVSNSGIAHQEALGPYLYSRTVHVCFSM